MFTIDPFACSHHRAPDYYSESIRSYKGFWGWACTSYINYLLGMCPKTNFLVVAGEDSVVTTRGMFLVTTNGESPFAIGRWTELVGGGLKNGFYNINRPFNKGEPLQKQIDEWGKLDGEFNNKKIEPNMAEPNSGWRPFNSLLDSNWEDEENVGHSNDIPLSHVKVKLEKKVTFGDRYAPSKNSNDDKVLNEISSENYKKNKTNDITFPEVSELPKIVLNGRS